MFPIYELLQFPPPSRPFPIFGILSGLAGGMAASGIIIGFLVTIFRPHAEEFVFKSLKARAAEFKKWNDNLYQEEMQRQRETDKRSNETSAAMHNLEHKFDQMRVELGPAAQLVPRIVDTLDRVETIAARLDDNQRSMALEMTRMAQRQSEKTEAIDRLGKTMKEIDNRQRESETHIAGLQARQRGRS